MMKRLLASHLRRFLRDETGVALVEFALFLPVFALAFYVIVEFSRTFFAYQGAISGVRDATRFAARTISSDICVGQSDGSGAVVSSATSQAIIERNMQNENDILPTNVRIVSVSTSYRCVVPVAGTYRQDEVPIARVFARIEIVLPLGEILVINGGPLIPNITTDVVEESRVFGA